MKFLQKANNMQAYAKVGLFGFQGSGKTHTAMLLAMGLCDLSKNNKIAFFDTETGSDWWATRMEGYEMYQIKSRAFKDLMGTIRECESEGVSVLVIDSVTHIWRDVMESYLDAINKKFLRFCDWGPIKKTWGQYTDLFVNSKLHIIVCGRAGYEYEQQENDRGKLEPVKTGTKMKAESEFGFEPSLVLEMEAIRGVEVGAGIKNIAHVLKDRSNTINGKSFQMPSFENFKEHFDALNIGGEHLGVSSENSEDLFDKYGDDATNSDEKAKKIALDELQQELVKHFPGRTAQDTKCKADILEAVFSTRSWDRIKGHEKVDSIQWGLLKARYFLNEIDSETKFEALSSGTDGGKVIDANASVSEIKRILTDQFPEEDQ